MAHDKKLQPRIVALIPLRGGSKSIPGKNIKEIAGKPLAYWVLKAAVDAPSIEQVFVSTDDAKIKQVVGALGLCVQIVDRPSELAGDVTTTDAVMLHFMEQYPEFDILVTIQATSPLTTSADLEEALRQFKTEGDDSLLTGVRIKRFFWDDAGVPYNYDYKSRPMRQQFKGTLMENGAFYITRKEILERERNRLGGKIGIFEFPAEHGAELDEPEDWEKTENLLLARLRAK